MFVLKMQIINQSSTKEIAGQTNVTEIVSMVPPTLCFENPQADDPTINLDRFSDRFEYAIRHAGSVTECCWDVWLSSRRWM